MRKARLGFFFLALLFQPAAQCQENLYFFAGNNSFSTTGKWVPTDPTDKPAYPTETQIDCFKDNLTCIEATADYYLSHPHVTLTYYRINRWDKDGLIATSSNGICMAVTILVSFPDKTLDSTFAMKQLPEKQRNACRSLGASKTEMTFVIKNSERWNKEHDAVWLNPKN